MPGRSDGGSRARLRNLTQSAGVRVVALCVCVAGAAIACHAQKESNEARLVVSYEEPFADQRYPELVYWFVTPETLASERYTHDILHLANDTEFNFAFLTAREGVVFVNSPAAHQAIAGIVKTAHQHDLRIGATIGLGGGDSTITYSDEEKQTAVADADGTLDAEGQGTVEAAVALRQSVPERTKLLRVFVFRRTERGEYDPATLRDVTAQALSNVPKPGQISVTLRLGPAYAGYTAFVLAATWFNTVDLFNDAYKIWIHRAIDQYRDVPLDGTSLDEFKYTPLPVAPSTNTGTFSARARLAWRTSFSSTRDRSSARRRWPEFITPFTIT